MKTVFRLGVALSVMAFAATQAHAQDTTETDEGNGVITVIGTPSENYFSRSAEVGDRLGKDILNIPRSVESIPEQLLTDQHVRELSEIYRYSPNVAISDGYGGTREDYLIRGFRRRDDVYRDGVRLKTNNTVDPSTVASVEILKGPTSDIGQMTPGGLVNYVTRRPKLDPAYRAEVNFDSRGERQGFFDATGPLGGGFAYRVAGSYENGHTFRQYSDQERLFAYGAVSWFGDNGTEIRTSFEYGDDSRALDRGIVTVPDPTGKYARVVADVPRKLSYHSPFTQRDADYIFASADLSMPISEQLLFEAKVVYYDENSSDVHVEVGGILSDSTLVRYVQGNDDRDLKTQFYRAQIRTSEGGIGPFSAVIGAEYRHQTEFWINYRGPLQVLGTVTDPMSDLLVNDGRDYVLRNKFDVSQTDYGFYALTDITLHETFVVTLGGRYETYKGAFDNGSLLSGAISAMDFPSGDKFTKSGAIAWHPTPETTVYANYSDTFQPASYYANNPTIFPAQNGRMYEAGVKQALFNNGLMITGAYFDVKQDNVVENVDGEARLTGGQTSRGFELGVVGSPMKGLNLRGGVAYVDAQTVSAIPADDGLRPRNVPSWTASLWTSYEFKDPDHPLVGLGFGLGATYGSDRWGDTRQAFMIGDYTIVDSSLWYYIPLGSGPQLRLNAGVKNVFDERYYTSAGGTYRIGVGTPRTVFVGLGIDL
ncbi:TonB-dependent siderophore receptor [Novosphingobium sp. BW1]|uniref:TonB-dependent siderophore receptor n=1 Tax=Novosphingobium sp. BW1 TaxID=2592621 RepID=UPI0011DEF88B|nr:TonB-dependent siderophore receptor [Novosphingobium sp. BW1]TYC94415.1 TonB-dependent siderophore receptor [Novosphingobium sp. BW1]